MMFYFGVDYYPEHWQETRWETDARLMQEAGFNVVRLAEFAWALLEPRDGEFDFDWLDRAIHVLTARGMKIVLGTPSAAPPPWLWQKLPDSVLVDENGTPREYGSRREYSPTHPGYRTHAVRIARAMGEHYKAHPHVIGWQIDNEFGDRCYAPSTRLAFQTWLKECYGSLEALNECWGTRFWSQLYTDWSQIPLPTRRVHAQHNPSLHLDYYRFMSEVYVEFQQLQVDALRAICPPEQFITHNFMGFGYQQINYFDLAKTLDMVSWDNYPRGFWITTSAIQPAPIALSHATMRGLKKKHFWVMEQQSGQGAWDTLPPITRPGEIALWAYQSIAHGADGIVFFRWRTSRFGVEQYWHGILDHDGQSRRRYAEVRQMGQEIARVGGLIAGSEVRSEVAIMLSYDSRFAFQIQPNNPDFSYDRHVTDYYTALHRANIPVDILAPDDDLTGGYKLVIVPALYITEQQTVQTLTRFAEGGGTVIITARSGVKDHTNLVVDQPLPGLFAPLCGVTVEEYDSPLSGDSVNLRFTADDFVGAGKAAAWCDILSLTTARALAKYDAIFYAGQPAVTHNQVGAGHVIYVGTMGDATLVNSLMAYALQLAGVGKGPLTPTGVEAVRRWQGDTSLLFLLNHTDHAQSVGIDADYLDLLSETQQSATVMLQPKQVMILQPVPSATQ
jgi:beta-galactosidase